MHDASRNRRTNVDADNVSSIAATTECLEVMLALHAMAFVEASAGRGWDAPGGVGAIVGGMANCLEGNPSQRQISVQLMDVSKHIAEVLGETEPMPLSQIAAVVEALGEVEALGVLAQTERVESTGGMMVPDGSRKRTRGGIFFALARATLTPTQRRAIFTYVPKPRQGPYAMPATDAAIQAVGATQVLVQLPRRDAKGAPATVPVAAPAPRPVPAVSVGPEGAFEQLVKIFESVEPAGRAELERRLRERFAPGDLERPAASIEVLPGVEARVRQWLVACVAEQLGLPPGTAAQSVFGADSESNRQRVEELQGLTMQGLIRAALVLDETGNPRAH